MLLGGHIKALLKGSSLLDRVLHELQILSATHCLRHRVHVYCHVF